MDTVGHVPKERLEIALQQIRADVAQLHRDLAAGAGNEARWIFLLMWLILGDFFRGAFGLSPLYAVLAAALIVGAYRVLDGMRVTATAMRMLKKPLEPTWDTKVEL